MPFHIPERRFGGCRVIRLRVQARIEFFEFPGVWLGRDVDQSAAAAFADLEVVLRCYDFVAGCAAQVTIDLFDRLNVEGMVYGGEEGSFYKHQNILQFRNGFAEGLRDTLVIYLTIVYVDPAPERRTLGDRLLEVFVRQREGIFHGNVRERIG